MLNVEHQNEYERDVGCIFLLEDANSLAVDDQILAISGDGARVLSVNGIVLKLIDHVVWRQDCSTERKNEASTNCAKNKANSSYMDR